jgi:pyruvate,orthophosphate dikinase
MSDPDLLFIGVPGRTEELTAEIAGSKAAQLWRMSRLGLTVPPAFVLPTTLCAAINRDDPAAMARLEAGLRDGIAQLEEVTGRRFGGSREPLLVSVRSGAAQSMPGMLSTVLDVGMTSASLRGLILLSGNPRLAWDSYRRFIQSYAETVDAIPAKPFEAQLAEMIHAEHVAHERELDPEALERLSGAFLAIAARVGHAIPDEPQAQLMAAARAIYRSWDGERAKDYRRLNRLEGLQGTAVTVQAMVFGNSGARSGAGVAFSRNPATGADEPYIDFLFDAQGEDVVAGRRIPEDGRVLAERLPEAARELNDGLSRLEREFRDLQDVEFTVESGKLYFLQTRSAKRTPRAALRVLVDLVGEGILDPATALVRASQIDAESARVTHFAEPAPAIATAIAASPGVASGRTAFSSARAKAFAESGEPVILVRPDTSTDDIAGFAAASGILTALGARTAHAAVVARQLGKPCIVGCHDLRIADDERRGEIGGRAIEEGQWLSLDGETGEVSLGRRSIVAELPQAELAEIESWRRTR